MGPVADEADPAAKVSVSQQATRLNLDAMVVRSDVSGEDDEVSLRGRTPHGSDRSTATSGYASGGP